MGWYKVFILMGRNLLLVVCSIFISETLSAQYAESLHVAIPNDALSKAIDLYDEKVSRNTMLYSGVSYFGQYSNIKGHQFFGEDYWVQGNVSYDGQRYDSIFLKYDLYKDQLLIENFNSDGFLSPIIVYAKKVDAFNIFDHYFIKIDADTNSTIRTGYYNLMYQGDELQFLVQRRKEIVDSNEISTIREEFMEKDRYYIKKNDIYHRFRSKKALLKVLKDRKKELRTFIKRHALQFKLNPDIEFAKVVQYYDSLP